MVFEENTFSELTKIVNHELSFVATWFKANKLTLHPDKTKFILFHRARKKINLDGLSISIDKNSIDRVEHTKFLGVIIHQNRSWRPLNCDNSSSQMRLVEKTTHCPKG